MDGDPYDLTKPEDQGAAGGGADDTQDNKFPDDPSDTVDQRKKFRWPEVQDQRTLKKYLCFLKKRVAYPSQRALQKPFHRGEIFRTSYDRRRKSGNNGG